MIDTDLVFSKILEEYLPKKDDPGALEVAFVSCRPWIWSVVFGIGSFCSVESSYGKKQKVIASPPPLLKKLVF